MKKIKDPKYKEKKLCECGSMISKSGFASHLKTFRHTKLIKEQEDKERYDFITQKWEEICNYCREIEDLGIINLVRSRFILLFLIKLFELCEIKKNIIFTAKNYKELCLCGCLIIKRELEEHKQTTLHINKINSIITKDEEYERIKKIMLVWQEIIDYIEKLKKRKRQRHFTSDNVFDLLIEMQYSKFEMVLNSI